MSENPFDEAMADAEADQDGSDETGEETDVMAALDADGEKTKTIAFRVTPEMHAVYRELRESDDVAVDPAEDFRDHIRSLARRFPDEADRAMQILELKRGR